MTEPPPQPPADTAGLVDLVIGFIATATNELAQGVHGWPEARMHYGWAASFLRHHQDAPAGFGPLVDDLEGIRRTLGMAINMLGRGDTPDDAMGQRLVSDAQRLAAKAAQLSSLGTREPAEVLALFEPPRH